MIRYGGCAYLPRSPSVTVAVADWLTMSTRIGR
jgi:hypothetical protein